jgi:hypothetical protein
LTDYSQPAWYWLRRELDRWAEAGLTAEFWWRDDDAIERTPQLEKLIGLGNRYETPLALAVIPAKLKADLVDVVASQPQVSVLQHGYAHISHAEPGQRKLELGGSKNVDHVMTDLKTGLDHLQQQFSSRFYPVLVPPWNRIDAAIITRLAEVGFIGLSAMKVRKSARPAVGLRQINTHLDPINWRHHQGFIGDFPAIAILVQHLIAKRCGYRDSEEPTGLLTHHLVQNERVWIFVESLLQFINDHPAAGWCSVDSIWD